MVTLSLLYVKQYIPSVYQIVSHYINKDGNKSLHTGSFWDFELDPQLIASFTAIEKYYQLLYNNNRSVMIDSNASISSLYYQVYKQSTKTTHHSLFVPYFILFSLSMGHASKELLQDLYSMMHLSASLPSSLPPYAFFDDEIYNYLKNATIQSDIELEILINMMYNLLLNSHIKKENEAEFYSRLEGLFETYLQQLSQMNPSHFINVIHTDTVYGLIHSPNAHLYPFACILYKMIGSSSCDTVRLDIEKLIHYISNENFSPVCDDLTILPNGLECSMIRLLFYIYDKLPTYLHISLYTLLLNRIGDQDIQEFLQTSKFDYILPLQQDLFVLLLNIIKTHKEMQTLCFRILYNSLLYYIDDYNTKSCLYISKNEVISKVSHQYKEKEVQVSVLHKDQYEFSFFYELMDSELMMILIEHNSDPLYSNILDLLFQLDNNLAVLYMDELFKNESTIR